MPRRARQQSESGITHVVVRGINREVIFHDILDYRCFLEFLRKVLSETGAVLLAYCLMPNHVHLLIQEGDQSISVLMHRLGVRYAYWFNKKYHRTGHVFQDRFFSRPVEDDGYLLMVIHYIHFNPVKAKLCDAPEDYLWSSRRGLVSGDSLVDRARLAQLIPIEALLRSERAYPLESSFGEQLDRSLEFRPYPIADDEMRARLTQVVGVADAEAIRDLPRDQQRVGVSALQAAGASIRQISRLTGLDRKVVTRWQAA